MNTTTNTKRVRGESIKAGDVLDMLGGPRKVIAIHQYTGPLAEVCAIAEVEGRWGSPSVRVSLTRGFENVIAA